MGTSWGKITKSGCLPEITSRIRFLAVGTSGIATAPAAPAAGRRIKFVDGLSNITSPQPRNSNLVKPLARHSYAESVPEVSYQLRSGGSVTTTICGRVCRALAEHCGESNVHGREVGGILVGSNCERRNAFRGREFSVFVTDLIPIRSFDSSSAHVSFTEDDWIAAERELQQKYAPEGKCQLGWYHTHPLQGVFFSIQDRRAHEIFPQPYQFALAIDPRTMEAGFFHWSSYEERVMGGPICFNLHRGGK